MRTTAARLGGLGTTIFAEMSARALATESVNLGQGFPEVDGPERIRELAVAAIRDGRNQYPPGGGTPELRRAVADHQRRLYGLEVDPVAGVTVTTGATEAVASALLGLVDPGDEVVVLEPYYDSYVAMLQMAGADRRPVTLRAPDFRLPVDELRAAVTSRTTAILLNSPHNPTGAVLTRDELQAVADLAIEHDLVVISDEVYEHLTFDVPHVPIATLPGMAERTVTISSGGKSFSLTGWKIGWASGPADLIASVTGVKQFLTYQGGAPFQPAVAAALDDAEAITSALRDELRARRDQLCGGLRDLGLTTFVPDGTYFATTDVGADGVEFCLALPERCSVVAIPHAVFHDGPHGDTLVRWAFCKSEATLAEALERLARL